ncbi:MAG: outer membrane protein assembly factor BamE domain-containing protein, partial [Sodalis sp. (in: enterobacteria)]
MNAADVAKINIGMTKQQVSDILGTSIMKDPFGSNTCYYISRRNLSHKVV